MKPKTISMGKDNKHIFYLSPKTAPVYPKVGESTEVSMGLPFPPKSIIVLKDGTMYASPYAIFDMENNGGWDES